MNRSIRFGRLEVHPVERRVLVDGQPVALGGRGFDVLLTLIQRCDQVVSKDELLDAVWPGLVVTEANVQVQVSALRAAIGRDAIVTVPGLGYRFALASFDAARDGDGVAPEVIDKPSVAVARFACASQGSLVLEAEEFAQGLVVELARNADLKVAAHADAGPIASAYRYGDRGSLRDRAQPSHLEVKLVDELAGRIVWTVRHPRSRSVESLQALAAGLHMAIWLAEVERAFAVVEPEDPYLLVMKSLATYRAFNVDGFERSRALLDKVLAGHPGFALAWAWQAMLLMNRAGLATTDAQSCDLLHQAIDHAWRARILDPRQPVAWRALAFAHALLGDHGAALPAVRRSIDLSPSNPESYQALALILHIRGSNDEARVACERAIAWNPWPSPWTMLTLGAVLLVDGRPLDALDAIDTSRAEHPERWVMSLYRISALAELHRDEEAALEAGQLRARHPELCCRALRPRWVAGAASAFDRYVCTSADGDMPARAAAAPAAGSA